MKNKKDTAKIKQIQSTQSFSPIRDGTTPLQTYMTSTATHHSETWPLNGVIGRKRKSRPKALSAGYPYALPSKAPSNSLLSA